MSSTESPATDRVDTADEVFFHAEHSNGMTRVTGTPAHLLGHPILVLGREQADGVFARWVWNGHRLVVENDRYGMWPLFWFSDARRICIAPSLQVVVRKCGLRQLDFGALGVFFRLGHFVGNDTPVEGVRVLAPGTRMTWEAGQLTMESKGKPMPSPPGHRWSLDDACEQYRVLFAKAIERRAPSNPNFIVPISGGRDSRHILLELHRQGYKPQETITVRYRPPARNDDLRIGRLLSDRVGVAHRVFDPPGSLLGAALQDIRACNHCSSGHIWAAPLAEAPSLKHSIVYDGLAGDVLSAGLLQDTTKAQFFETGELDALAVHLIDEANREQAIKAALGRSWLKKMDRTSAVDRISAELEAHRAAPNPVLSYTFWNRTRRLIGLIPFGLLRDAAIVHTPYLDHDLFDFFCTLSLDVVAKNRLHDEVIKRSYPEFADINFESKRSAYPSADLESKLHAQRYFAKVRKDLLIFMLLQAPRLVGNTSYVRNLVRLVQEFGLKPDHEPWYLYPVLQVEQLSELVTVTR